jgi:DNA polymerase-3 subunit gamma/tau
MSKNSVLATKYRPRVFDDLIGQDIIRDTIYNSIQSNKIPNAYLLTGIRGTGKTTLARLIAKSLMCVNGIENLCKEKFCENCESISNSNNLDVLEMDSANKTSVNDVRELIEIAKFPPTLGKYKIYILDEAHQMSSSAMSALLKTLENPPPYLKIIFSTTDPRKLPVTILSRCQRYDLSRVKSKELFEYVKKIYELENKDKENIKIGDDALKLIVKVSEGSVRDCLSLLDRLLITQTEGKELNLKIAQKIFGYFDKSSLIELFKYLFEGNEEEVIRIYRSIYDAGVEPKVFLNDFLELLYYFKNISSLKLEGTNFSLNDEEFKQISQLASNLSVETLILFWQFTIKTMDELYIVSNQNLSIEMFLIRLLYLKHIKQNNVSGINNINIQDKKLNDQDKLFTTKGDQNLSIKNKTISQIKNISQEEKTLPKTQLNESKGKIEIRDFDDLINICNQKKEIKLKYELETNVNIVSFEDQRIEISFNENLDRDFVKYISTKLFEWTNQRWIITLSKKNGTPTKKQIKKQNKQILLEEAKKSIVYKKMIELFPDTELVDVEIRDKND